MRKRKEGDLELDSITILLKVFAFLIYGAICIISIMFTFFIEQYRKLDEIFNLDIINTKILTPLEINIDIIDAWLIGHNRIVGPILIFLSLLDMKLYLDMVNLF